MFVHGIVYGCGWFVDGVVFGEVGFLAAAATVELEHSQMLAAGLRKLGWECTILEVDLPTDDLFELPPKLLEL